MKQKPLLILLLVIFSSFSTGLLSASSKNTQNSISDQTIKDQVDPVDEDYGYLVVQIPEEIANEKVYSYKLRYEGENVLVGVPLKTAVGSSCLFVDSPEFINSAKLCSVEIHRHETTTIKLSAIRIAFDQSLLETDVEPHQGIRVFQNGQTLGSSIASEAWSGAQNAGYVVLPEGKYLFFAPGVETQLILSPGVFIILDPLDGVDFRSEISVLPPPERKFPDPQLSSCESLGRTFLVLRDSKNNENRFTYEPHPYDVVQGKVSERSKAFGIIDFKTLPMATAENPFVFSADAGTQHEIVTNNFSMTLKTKPRETLQVPLKRIDVNDVTVSGPDNSPAFVAGTYQIFRKIPSGWRPLYLVGNQFSNTCYHQGDLFKKYDTFATKTGVDVIPGEYRVQVTYRAYGSERHLNYDLDLR